MLRGCRTPTSTATDTAASTAATHVVSPPTKLQAVSSVISWTTTTGLRAQDRTRHRPEAHHTSAPPSTAKKTAVVTATLARSASTWASSSTA